MAAICAGSITSNFKFAAKVPLLMKATSSDEKPTQGYVLQEICKISKSSLPNCQSLLKFLLGRLEQNDPRIKFKALHLMKYLVINGHSEFRSGLRRSPESVKQTVNYRGQLDAIHGDGLNLKVQQTASELEKLLFDVDNPEVEVIYKSMLASNESGKKMEGFGNTQTLEIKKEPSFKDTLLNFTKSGSELLTKMKSNVPANEYTPTFSTPQPQYTPVDIEDGDVTSSDDENDVNCDGSDGEINDDHYYERKLVETVTAGGGITRIPSTDVLKDFLHKSASLNVQVILDILDERLQNPSVNIQLKSLCVVEYLLRSNVSNIAREIHGHCSSVHALTESQDQTVQAKANKITLAVASCLKRDENPAASKAKVVVPPSYHEAKELPKVQPLQDKSENQTEHKAQINSLFTGMNISAGARSDESDNRKVACESLIDIEGTPDNTLLNEPDSSTMPDTRNSALKQSDKQTNEVTSINLCSDQSSSNFDLMSLELPGGIHDFSTQGVPVLPANEVKSNLNAQKACKQSENKYSSLDEVTTTEASCDFDNALQKAGGGTLNSRRNDEPRNILNPKDETGKRGVNSDVFNLNNIDSLNWRPLDNMLSSEENPENLLLNTQQQNAYPSQMLPQNSNHIFPQRTAPVTSETPHNNLLTFQAQPRAQTLPGSLVLPTSSSSTARRPFPKDMKAETDGFDFIRKSKRGDAFSFISDEIQASKTKPK